MSEYKNITISTTLTIIDSCIICGHLLTNEFPKDFPEIFKMCCNCLDWGRIIIIRGKKLVLEYNCDGIWGTKKRFEKQINEIEKIITLVGK